MASSIEGTKLGSGISKLIDDVTSWLMILAVPFAGLMLIYLFIRKSTSDEMDAKKYNQRITTTLICFVAIELSSVIIQILKNYFG